MRDWEAILGLPLWVWLFGIPTILAALCLFLPNLIGRVLHPVWSFLDKVYVASGVLAACFMVMILLLIFAKMIARWSGWAFPGSTEYAGYAMAATSFFCVGPCFDVGRAYKGFNPAEH